MDTCSCTVDNLCTQELKVLGSVQPDFMCACEPMTSALSVFQIGLCQCCLQNQIKVHDNSSIHEHSRYDHDVITIIMMIVIPILPKMIIKIRIRMVTSCALQLEAARKRLSKLAKQSGQQRFAPADLTAFIASLPDTQEEDLHVSPSAPLQAPQSSSLDLNADLDQFSHPGEGPKPTGQPWGLQSMADVSGVPREGRGGARVKGAMKGLRAVNIKHKGLMPGD